MNNSDLATSAANGAYKVGATVALAGAAWSLQDWSHAAAIASAVVAAIAGVIYSVKMLIEIYWTVRLKKAEANRLERGN